jgi:hypothetical protein
MRNPTTPRELQRAGFATLGTPAGSGKAVTENLLANRVAKSLANRSNDGCMAGWDALPTTIARRGD